MEFKVAQAGELAARDDDQYAGERDQHARDLPSRCLFTLEDPGAREHEKRSGGIDEHGVDRARRAQLEIDEGLERRHAGERQHDEEPSMAANDRAVPERFAKPQRRHDERRHQPAPEVERHRIERLAHRPPDNPVARPQQICEHEQGEGGEAVGAHQNSARTTSHGTEILPSAARSMSPILASAVTSVCTFL